MNTFRFTVDAALLRELGERLVGRPHIALAELIKNSYDADATLVEIVFESHEITISDNGHGMTEKDFEERWMRVGTTRKRADAVSPHLARSMTGSKGVGRLAVQLLARQFEITSVALTDPSDPDASTTEEPIRANVDWDQAVQAGELTSVKVPVTNPKSVAAFPGEAQHGTTIVLRGLTQRWDRESFAALAEEIWVLQPPFQLGDSRQFKVVLRSDDADVTQVFAQRMNAIFDIWNARIVGRLIPAADSDTARAAMALPPSLPLTETGSETTDIADRRAYEASLKLPTRYLEATVEVRGVSERTVVWRVENCEIDELEFEIRVFDLVGRQPEGIKVDLARSYLRKYGGVAIYDNGFRLPYYGTDQDWLRNERDHGRRLTVSELIPEELKVDRGLLDLPPNEKLFGWVAVSTSHEERHRLTSEDPEAPALSIQVTRDRLVENQPLERMRVMLRAALDMYAMERARSKLPPPPRPDAPTPTPTSDHLSGLAATLREVRVQIPAPVYRELKVAVDEALSTARSEEEAAQSYRAILAALATAGMTSLAYEHEMSKQVRSIGDLAEEITEIGEGLQPEARRELESVARRVEEWVERVQAIRELFTPLLRKEVREKPQRLRAAPTISRVAEFLEPLSNQAPVDTSGIPLDLFLPKATYPAWASVFQNLLINAFNAVHSEPRPRVIVDGGGDDARGWIRVMDNGVGVDLDKAQRLWLPFERDLELPSEVEEAGLGGMGLGLAIVKMILDGLGVRASFVQPPKNMSTAVRIDWTHKR